MSRTGRRPAAEVLERRYRRLLATYPADYRAANADDMLGVALARSAAGRRWPELSGQWGMFELVPATSLAVGLIWLYGWEHLRRTRAKAPAAAEH